jgi:ketosteroid isomerase-like protein
VGEGNVVRWLVEPLDRPRRGVDERFALAVPWLSRLMAAVIERLPAGSRVRRAGLTRVVRTGWAATNRDDYEAMQASFHPDVEFIPPSRGEAGLGFDAVYRGPDAVTRFVRQWKSGFARFRYEPREIADPGGRSFAVRLGMIATMRDADTEVRDEYGTVIRLEGGRIIRQENFYDWDVALRVLTSPRRSAGPDPDRD